MKEILRTKVKDLLEMKAGQEVLAKGWVRTKRGNKEIAFIALNDGSTIKNVQIVVDKNAETEPVLAQISTGACICVRGNLVESVGSGQAVEIKAEQIEVYGTCDPMRYPLQKKDTSFEYLRTVAHMRPRTNTFGAIYRLRSQMAFAIHEYFHSKGFVYLHTPLITESDCEGAGQMFQVTTLDLENVPRDKKGRIDYGKDFFGKQTSLTVSGQLEGELGATALGEIYTFGPTFRAENSNTPRHLAEFWMIEPEMAFYDIKDNMDLAEDFIKHLVSYALEHCMDDIQFLNDRYDPELVERLRSVIGTEFVRLEYTEGIRILEEAVKNGVQFEYPVAWGIDLQSEHERYLVEKHFGKPVILTGYPKDIKAFYMKQNEDGKTVRAMDVLFPKIGEIIGGSEREADLGKLEARIDELGMSRKNLEWYIDTRRFGSCPHSGFGLGFERLLLFITGMQNIRDVKRMEQRKKDSTMLVIGIAGGSGSGKTTVVKAITEKLHGKSVVVIPQDSYYKDSSDLSDEEKRVHNFDHPDAIEWELLCSQLEDLKHGKAIRQPVYSFISCARSKTEVKVVEPAEVIIIEGILIFTCKELREQMDIKIFVDADDDDRLMRVMARDISERGKDVHWVIERYSRTVKPMYLQFIEPSKRYADIIIPQGGHNKVAIDMITATVEKSLTEHV